MKKVAVIGAGAAGLTATKRLTEPDSGFECCTFEQTDNVGGTWVYTDRVGQDEYGVPVHSSMYQGLRTREFYVLICTDVGTMGKRGTLFPPMNNGGQNIICTLVPDLGRFQQGYGLRNYKWASTYAKNDYRQRGTNLPIQIMELPDFSHRGPVNKSYLTSREVLNYFEEYAEHFNLNKYIKFRHRVNIVIPLANGQWKIEVTDLKRQKNRAYYFDAVIVCIGNYSNPVYPEIKGIEKFNGIQLHSHDYKNPTKFKDKNVVVIGAGPSGLDIANQVSAVANKVFLSHHKDQIRNMEFAENLIQKPDVLEATSNGIIFNDGTEENTDFIIHCTGYVYNYSFLSPECNITVQNKVVKPLYKQFINIEHPTMCIIGIPRDCPGFTLFDLQVKCFLNILSNKVRLPSKDKMYAETGIDMEERLKITGHEKYYHNMHKEAQKYFDSLSELGDLPATRQVVFDIYFYGMERMMEDFKNFRSKIYKLIDEERFEVCEC